MMRRVAKSMAVLTACLASGACSLPTADSGPRPTQHLLVAEFGEAGSAPDGAPVLMVARPRAGAGFDSPSMRYLEEPTQLDAFARNQWAAAPADMLQPLLVDAMEGTGAFRAVVDGGSGLRAGLRLDTEILRLQQEFFERPSRVRLALRAILVDARSGEVLMARTFETTETAPGDDPDSGVAAANRAVQRLLGRLAEAVAARTTARPQETSADTPESASRPSR